MNETSKLKTEMDDTALETQLKVLQRRRDILEGYVDLIQARFVKTEGRVGSLEERLRTNEKTFKGFND